MPTVALVEDHLLLAETLCAALRQRGIEATAFKPCETTTLLDALLAARPDLVLLDLDLGVFGDSTTIVRPLTAAGLRVLVVTGTTDRLGIAAALEQGAIGYQPKVDGFDAMLARTAAALQAAGGLDPVGRAELLLELAQARAARDRATALLRRLTDREQGTLRALGDGRSVQDIAEDWVVSEATVRTHVRGVLTKLGVRSQLAAVAAARRNGWLSGARRTDVHALTP